MVEEHTVIIGAGPCGLACAIALKEKGIEPIIIEKGSIVNSIYHFPTHQTFFSSSENLEIGEFPFVSERHKPVRNEALTYYREVVKRKNIRINTFEEVTNVIRRGDEYVLETVTNNGDKRQYKASHVIIATGYYDIPNKLSIPGETLSKVFHYFDEPHPYFGRDVVVIGGKNSAVDATIELEKAGAHVTVLYRGGSYSKSVKPWILPQFDSLVRHGKVNMEFNAHVTKITEHYVYYRVNDKEKKIKNDFVFAMTGYKPNIRFLKKIGIKVDEETGRPYFNKDTFETNLPNVYVAGVIISGFNTSETFIENGRLHGQYIANAIQSVEKSTL